MPVVQPIRPLTTSEPVIQPSSGKLIFLDNLKVFLTLLVILHHTAITYGADGNWFYKEVNQTVMPDSLILTLFAAVNQSFFMGLFFFISGCFVASSLHRKTATQFLSDKFIRLAIPVVLFILLIYPLTIWVGYYPWTWASFSTDFLRWLTQVHLEHSGPTWFIFVLLIFNVLVFAVRKPLLSWANTLPPLNGWHFFAVSFAVGIISFVTRLFFPDGFVVLNVQLSYLPQYIIYFLGGILLGKNGVLLLANQQKIKYWLTPAIVCFLVMLFALVVVKDTTPFKGGLNPWSVLYSFVQGFHSVAFSIVYVVLFYRIANTQAWWGGRLGRAAYGAFFIHAFVIVAIALAMKSFVLPPMVKFILLGIVGVPASFACGYLFTRLPGLRRVF